MSFPTLLAMAVGVGLDAMTAAVAVGFRLPRDRLFTAALCFGLTHAVMPLVGWFAVGLVAVWLERISGLIIVVTLTALGISRLCQSRRPEDSSDESVGLIALVTGLDSMSVGMTLALSPPVTGGIGMGCLVTAVITFLMCLVGVSFGRRLGKRFRKYALVAGGVLLLLLALRSALLLVF